MPATSQGMRVQRSRIVAQGRVLDWFGMPGIDEQRARGEEKKTEKESSGERTEKGKARNLYIYYIQRSAVVWPYFDIFADAAARARVLPDTELIFARASRDTMPRKDNKTRQRIDSY